MICVYHGGGDTPHEATQHIVWGCLNQHVHDFPICRYHIRGWQHDFGDGGIWCLTPDCKEVAADYMVDTRGMGL